MSEEKATIRLNGPWAILAIVIALGFFLYQFNAQHETLDTEAKEVLKTWLIAEYSRQVLPRLEDLMQHPSGNEKQIEHLVGQISHKNVQIVSIQSRGSGDDIAVKAEIEVNGQDPPYGDRIRYFRMSHSTLIGWQYEHEIGKWGYLLTF